MDNSSISRKARMGVANELGRAEARSLRLLMSAIAEWLLANPLIALSDNASVYVNRLAVAQYRL